MEKEIFICVEYETRSENLVILNNNQSWYCLKLEKRDEPLSVTWILI